MAHVLQDSAGKKVNDIKMHQLICFEILVLMLHYYILGIYHVKLGNVMYQAGQTKMNSYIGNT